MEFIFADFVQCNGFEDNLLDCNIDYEIGDMADSGYLLGVRCDGMNNVIKFLYASFKWHNGHKYEK